ncbi:MAG: dimethylsulfoxide reductase subunit B [Adlercreutzia sp.]|nr:dimethylsulfoxide reductase subunit B [Adlercreutzia sp.]
MAVTLGFLVDATRCTGCKTCVMACKDYNDLDAATAYRRVFDYEGGTWERDEVGAWTHRAWCYSLSLACNHCEEPVCAQVCPTGAMHKEANGLVRVDTHVCVGCGYCELACPYQAPHVGAETLQSQKCDGCYDRVERGQKPMCVEACPLRALDFGPLDELRAGADVVEAIAPLPEASHTRPCLAIRPPACARPVDDREGFLANPKEVE